MLAAARLASSRQMQTLRAAETATREEVREIYDGSPVQLESAMVGVSALYARLSGSPDASMCSSPPSSTANHASLETPFSSPASTVVGQQLFSSPRTLSGRVLHRGTTELVPRAAGTGMRATSAAPQAHVRSPWLAVSPGPLALSNPNGTEAALNAMLAHAREVSRRCRGFRPAQLPFTPADWDRCEKPRQNVKDRLEAIRRQEAEATRVILQLPFDYP